MCGRPGKPLALRKSCAKPASRLRNTLALASAPASAGSRPTLIALIVAAAFFMETLDGTVIATALPDMAKSFGVGAIQLSIGITAYMLTLAIFLPASGWLADRFGTRTVFGG